MRSPVLEGARRARTSSRPKPDYLGKEYVMGRRVTSAATLGEESERRVSQSQCSALAQPQQIAIFQTSSFWMSHNGRMWSGRFLRVGSPRDPLFFVTRCRGPWPVVEARARSNYMFCGKRNGASGRHSRDKLRAAPYRGA